MEFCFILNNISSLVIKICNLYLIISSGEIDLQSHVFFNTDGASN